MGANIYPCTIYQRLRPSEPEASEQARQAIWPIVDELVAQEGYTLCGRYGDSEFAPPFCGGLEIRPGYEQALEHARRIAAKLGHCALLIGDTSPIGAGDPFLPAFSAADHEAGVDVRLVNFHLRPHAVSTNLRAAWRYMENYRQAATQTRLRSITISSAKTTGRIELSVQQEPERWLAHLCLVNASEEPMCLRWSQHLRSANQESHVMYHSGWTELTIPPRYSAPVQTILQGELPWVRQFRVKYGLAGREAVGGVCITPSDVMRGVPPWTWENRD